MRITLPVSYTVKAIPFKNRLSSVMTMVESIAVDVVDVDAESLVSALVVTDGQGVEVERVHSYGGSFWIKDRRDGEDDKPFLTQHLRPAGRTVKDNGYGGNYDAKKKQEKRELEVLNDLGIVRSLTADVPSYHFRDLTYRDGGKLEFRECTVETERARAVERSDRTERLDRARIIAQNSCIAVNGALYFKVAEPCLISGGYDNSVDWRFGCPKYVTTEKISDLRGYPLSTKDFDRLEELLGTEKHPVKTAFSMEVLDESAFVVPTAKIAILANARRIVEKGLTWRNSTQFIGKWCEVRDYVAMMLGLYGREAKSVDEVLSMDEADYDRLAGLVEELGGFGEHHVYQYGDGYDLKGLRIWDGRSTTLEISPASGVEFRL